MAGKSVQERITAAEERIRQLEARKQSLCQQLRQQERRERTRRLIQIGAVMDRLGVDTLEKAQALQRQVDGRPEVKEWLRQVCAVTRQES